MYLKDLLTAKNNNLTFIRICLSIIVIYFHSFALTASPTGKDLFKKAFNVYSSGGTAVAMFFFISGVLITKSYLKKENVTEYLISRLCRLMPALIIATIILALIVGPLLSSLSFKDYFTNRLVYKFIYNNFIFNTTGSLPGVFETLKFPFTVNGSWWTLKYEFICYISLLMLGILGIFKNKNLCLLIGIIFIYITITSNPNPKFFIEYLYMFFAFGSLCFLFGDVIKINFKTIAAIIVLTYLSKDTQMYKCLFLVSCFFVCLWISINPLIMKINIKHDTSYGIYIYGFFVQQLFVYFFPSMNHNFNALFSILVCIPIGLLSAIYVEEPSIKFGKKLISKLNGRFNF